MKTPEEQIAELKQSLAQAKQKKTLRDEFAMAAMYFIGTNSTWLRPIDTIVMAKDAYDVADAMMKARSK